MSSSSAETIPDILRLQAEQSPGLPAFCYLNGQQWQTLSLKDCWLTVEKLAGAFRKLGLSAGDRVGIVLANCIEWELSHLGLLVARGVVVGLDINDDSEKIQYVSQHAELNALVVQGEWLLEKFSPEFLKQCKFIVVIQDNPETKLTTKLALTPWKSLLVNVPHDTASIEFPSAKDKATIIYTSGTTGTPKGIAYDHGQVTLACRAIIRTLEFQPGFRYLCWLPLANLFQRIIDLSALSSGGVTYIVNDPFKVMEYVQTVRPHVFIGVPRFYEKLYGTIQKQIASRPILLQSLIQIVISLGKERTKYLQQKRKVPLIVEMSWRFADRLVLTSIRQIMGGDSQRILSGSAPLSAKLLEFFRGLGLPFLEAYGLSENIVPIAINHPNDFRLGSVGKPLPENTVKLSVEGEVLVRGPGLFSGYYRDNTVRSCFTEDGFYACGDYGEFDNDGFLFLKGRTTDIIKTAGGRRLAPAKIETQLRQIPYIDQVCIVGSGRKYLVGILTFDWKVLGALAKQDDLSTQLIYNTLPASVQEKIIRDLKNSIEGLPYYEQPAGFMILRWSFSVQTGELTANFKLRRDFVQKKFAELINSFYQTLEQTHQRALVISVVSSAVLRMMKFGDMQALKAIKTSQMQRLGTTSHLAAHVLWSIIKYRGLRYFIGKEKANQRNDESIEFIAKLIRENLAPLKGPLVKFGQMLSYLAEDVPDPILSSLQSLQDTTPPLKGDIIRKIIEKELQKPINELFAEWNDTPIGAASISQIHYAKLKNGRPVIVKVRYPKIVDIVKNDLNIVKLMGPFITPFVVFANSKEIYKELRQLILAECDFLSEASYQREFYQIFAGDPEVIIPEVFMDYTTSEVLTMEYIEGKKFYEFKETATQEEKNRAGEIIWRMSCISVNRYCLFNADPHPGNYLFADDKVCFLDFGFTRRFSPEFMDLWKEQSIAGCADDLERFAKASTKLGFVKNQKKYNHRAWFDLMRSVVYLPWMEDKPFKFTRDFVKQELKGMFVENTNAGYQRLPIEFCAITRLFWGQHAVLADLEAEANWHRVVFPLLQEKTERPLSLS